MGFGEMLDDGTGDVGCEVELGFLCDCILETVDQDCNESSQSNFAQIAVPFQLQNTTKVSGRLLALCGCKCPDLGGK